MILNASRVFAVNNSIKINISTKSIPKNFDSVLSNDQKLHILQRKNIALQGFMNETEVHVLCTTGIRHKDIIIKDKTCMTYAVVTKRMHVLTAITV